MATTALSRAVLAQLPSDLRLTLTVGEILSITEQGAGASAGPENVDTKQAAARFGYTIDRWRRWAEGGKLRGAWQDARGGSWHLPLASCEAHIRTLQQRGRTVTARATRSEPSTGSVPRGPRRPRSQCRSAGPPPRAGGTDSPTLSIEAARGPAA